MLGSALPVTSPRLDTLIEIQTPEHLAFEIRIAGPVRRFFAWVLDMITRSILLVLLFFLYQAIFGALDLDGLGRGLQTLTLFLLDWGYFVFWEVVTGGRSPGKILMKLRVLREGGLPVNWQASVLRNLVRAVDFDLMLVLSMGLPPFGAMVMAFDPRFRRLGDMAAGTFVVIEEDTKIKNTKPLAVSPSFKETLPAVLPFSREEMEAIELFVRRAQLSDARREELASIVAKGFCERLEIDDAAKPSDLLAAIWATSQKTHSRGQP